MALKEYARKRDFKITAEPPAKASAKKGCRFVVQKHAASRLHYDFRLEMDGVLKSWAMPKGMPYTHGEKRLAMQTEDHPVAYIDFEGTIPKGQYGGGTVMVWDFGVYEPLSDAPLKELEGGKLHFKLTGTKLQGEWYLVRIKGEGTWLLVRGGEDVKPPTKKVEDTSALSGRSMAQLAKSNAVWESKPKTDQPAEKSAAPKKPPVPKTAEAAKKKPVKKSPMPAFIEPMKAKLTEAPPPGEWTWEIKFDGFRSLAIKRGKDVRLVSRNNKDLNEKFPSIVTAIGKLKPKNVMLDGEIAALDEKGRSSFQLLQAYEMGDHAAPLHYYVFDLLHLEGEDLRGLPLEERQQQLAEALEDRPSQVQLSANLGDEVEPLLEQARKLGLEGLIGKRKGSTYETGKRSGSWIKLKLLREQEFVIGGYTEPEGARQHIGALLTGVYEDGKLICTGKTGTGFNEKLLRTLHAQFKKIAADECPFTNLPAKTRGKWGQGITRAEMKRCHWVKPIMVCQIRFSEWTRDNRLRQPVFLGLREDKSAKEVIREKAS